MSNLTYRISYWLANAPSLNVMMILLFVGVVVCLAAFSGSLLCAFGSATEGLK